MQRIASSKVPKLSSFDQSMLRNAAFKTVTEKSELERIRRILRRAYFTTGSGAVALQKAGGCVGTKGRDWQGAVLSADTEGDGRVSKENLHKVLRTDLKINVNVLSQADFHTLFNYMDPKRNGFIMGSKFLAFVQDTPMPLQSKMVYKPEEMKKTFREALLRSTAPSGFKGFFTPKDARNASNANNPTSPRPGSPTAMGEGTTDAPPAIPVSQSHFMKTTRLGLHIPSSKISDDHLNLIYTRMKKDSADGEVDVNAISLENHLFMSTFNYIHWFKIFHIFIILSLE